jgi:hypothetical protein
MQSMVHVGRFCLLEMDVDSMFSWVETVKIEVGFKKAIVRRMHILANEIFDDMRHSLWS